MTERSASRGAGPTRADRAAALATCRRLDALRGWLRGYLHEDFAAEYGGAAGAARAFCLDATPTERRALAAEWREFRSLTDRWPLAEIAGALTRELGGAWVPASLRELAAVGRALDTCARG